MRFASPVLFASVAAAVVVVAAAAVANFFRHTRFALKPSHPQFFKTSQVPSIVAGIEAISVASSPVSLAILWDGWLRGIRTISTGCQKGKQRREWQSCGPIGQSSVSKNSWPV